MNSGSLYIVKPEGMALRREIRGMVEGAGLVVVKTFLAQIPEWFVRELYAGAPNNLWPVLSGYLVNKECEIALVEGHNATALLFATVGESSRPHKCLRGTIRRELFNSLEPIEYSGGLYYRNGIHRPRPGEAIAHRNLVSRL